MSYAAVGSAVVRARRQHSDHPNKVDNLAEDLRNTNINPEMVCQ